MSRSVVGFRPGFAVNRTIVGCWILSQASGRTSCSYCSSIFVRLPSYICIITIAIIIAIICITVIIMSIVANHELFGSLWEGAGAA